MPAPLVKPMIILAAAFAVLPPLAHSARTRRGFHQATGERPPYIVAFTSLFEAIANDETKLQIERGDLVLARNKSSAENSLSKELAASSEAIRGYLTSDFPPLAADPECARIAPDLRTKLEALAADTEALRHLVESDSKQVEKTEVRNAWNRHNADFRAILIDALKVPHFSLSSLRAPVVYNLAPVLFDASESPVYADVTKPDRAFIARTFGGKESLLREHDEVLAFRDEDDKEWKPVTTWRDILHTPEDSDPEGKHRISLRIRRGRITQEVTVGFVASMIDVD